MLLLIKIKSKSSLEVLYDFFIERKYNILDPTVETQLEVEVTDENQSEFETLIAVYIAYQYFARTVREKLITMVLDEELSNQFMDDAVNYFNRSPYWKGLTLILISSYFERSTSINLESFMLFNMKGYKHEIEKYVDAMYNIKVIEDAEIDTEYDEESSLNIVPENGTDPELEEMYQQIKTTVLALNIDLSKFETIHLRFNNDALQFQTDCGIVLDQKGIFENFGVDLQLTLDGATKPWHHDLILFPVICMILPVNKMIIHKLESNVRESIESTRAMIIPSLTSVEIVDCNGCNACNE